MNNHAQPDLKRETVVASPLALDVNWSNGTISSINPRFAEQDETSSLCSAHAEQLGASLERYVSGKPPQWPELPLDMSALTDFQRAVLDATQTIPSGATRTYGELAASIGSPAGAQAVGRVMAANPFPILYPCHRVLGANGKLVGFSAEGGLKLKRLLLRIEGALL